jgi:Pyruvate/2-oxoacid:ferredoxin oxidoreductase gamma subunit
VLLATEAHEAMRYLPYLRSGGTALVNRLWIVSSAGRPDVDSIAARAAKESAGDAQAQADRNSLRMVWLNGTEVVHEHDCPKCLNMYMVGALAELLPVPEQHWRPALRRMVPESHFAVNLEMFLAGREAARARGLDRQSAANRPSDADRNRRTDAISGDHR